MQSSHVSRELSAFCHGELDPRDAARVSDHVAACARCRAELDEVRRGVQIATGLAPVPTPPGTWTAIVDAVRDRDTMRPAHSAARRRAWWLVPIAAVACLLAAIGAAGVWQALRPETSWPVASLGGSIRVGGAAIADRGTLAIGGVLETGASARATIAVGRIGQVEVAPNSRVRLTEAGWIDRRLTLERGSIRAAIFAPPRMFFVDTPSSTAVDLGCAYALSVTERGDTTLTVTSGWVALESETRQVLVPAGASCRSGRAGPGTPYFDDAAEELVEGLRAIEAAGNPAARSTATDRVLAAARPRDTLTLWHLIASSSPDDRARVVDRLMALAPPPPGATRAATIALDPEALDRWRRTFAPAWKREPAWRGLWRSVAGALHR
jgi:anti-sigma factor RsiW